MVSRSLITALLAARYAAAEDLRFGCSQLVVERSDPIVQPGMLPSAHVHQIVGGNAFNSTMTPVDYDPAKLSTCTSCLYDEDRSNYWTGTLYFKSPENGTFRLVPQKANWRRIGSTELLPQKGGLTVYYMPGFGGKSTKTTAFKPGFRMIAGDPTIRTKAATFPGICHRCQGNGDGFAPCDSRDTSELPLKMCPGGIRATVIFPSCWDGKNLDSPDHRSHMAYTPTGRALAGDECPASHPVRVPQVMYEIMLDTTPFNDPKYFEGGKQPFVYSFGDDVGHGQHGDYLFGWKDDSLQRAMDELGKNGCYDDNCSSVLKIQDAKDVIGCTIPSRVPESVGVDGGWLSSIPGSAVVS